MQINLNTNRLNTSYSQPSLQNIYVLTLHERDSSSHFWVILHFLTEKTADYSKLPDSLIDNSEIHLSH